MTDSQRTESDEPINRDLAESTEPADDTSVEAQIAGLREENESLRKRLDALEASLVDHDSRDGAPTGSENNAHRLALDEPTDERPALGERGDESVASRKTVTTDTVPISSTYKTRGKLAAPTGAGVLGHNTATSGAALGVEGVADAAGDNTTDAIPAGVKGSVTGDGVVRGVWGEANTTAGRGVVGTANKTSGSQHATSPGYPAGVWAVTDQSTADTGVNNAFGVAAQATATSGKAYGIYGSNNSPNGFGVYAEDFGSQNSYAALLPAAFSKQAASRPV